MATQTQATIQIPLDIPNVEVLRTEIHSDGKLLIWVESQVETVPCGLCGREVRATFGHGQGIQLRHLPVLGMETYICIRPRRARCLVCETEPTTTQVLDWYDQRSPHTKAYDRFLLKQLVNGTIEDVSLGENVGYDAIVGALKGHSGRYARIIKTSMRRSGYDYDASFNTHLACIKPIPCVKN